MQNPNGQKRIVKEEQFLSKFSSLMSFKNIRNDEPNVPQDQNVVVQSQKEDRVVKFKNAITTDEERNQWISLTQEMGGKYDQLVGTIKKTKTKIKQNGVEQGDLEERDQRLVSALEEEQKFILHKSQGFFEYAPHYPKVNHNKRQQITEKYIDPDLDQYYAYDPIKICLKENFQINQKLQWRQNNTLHGFENHTTHQQFHDNLHPNSIIVEQNIGRYLTNLAVQLKLDLIEGFDNDYVTINGAKCSYQQVPRQLMTVINHYEDIYRLHFFKEADIKNFHDQDVDILTQQQKDIIQAVKRDLRKIEQQFKEKKNIKIEDINTSSNTEQEVQYLKELIPKTNINNHHKLQIIHNILQDYNTEKVRLTVPKLEIIKNENKSESQEDDDQKFLTDNTYSEVSIGKLNDSLSDESLTCQSNHSDVQEFIFDTLNGENKKKKTFSIKPAYYKQQILEQNEKVKSKKESGKKKVDNKLHISLQLDKEKIKIMRKNNLLVQRDVHLSEQELQFYNKEQQVSSNYDSSDSEETEIIVKKKEPFEIPQQAWNLDNIGIYNELKKRGEISDDIQIPEVQEMSNTEMERMIRARIDKTKNRQLDEIIRDLDNKEQNELIEVQLGRQLFSGEFKRQIEKQFEKSSEKKQEGEESDSSESSEQQEEIQDIDYFKQFIIPGTNHIDFAKMRNSEIREYYDRMKNATDPFADGTQFMQIFKFKDLELEKVDQQDKPKSIYEQPEDKLVDKIEKINKRFKYHKLILQNGLYQGFDLYEIDLMAKKQRYKNNQRVGAKEQGENSQSYHSLKASQSNKDTKSQGPQSQVTHRTQRRPHAKNQILEQIQQRQQIVKEQNGGINFVQFHKQFAERAERYNELDIDHEEVVNRPAQRLSYQEFLASLQRIESNQGKDTDVTEEREKVIKKNEKPSKEERQSLVTNERVSLVHGMAKDTKVKKIYKQNPKDDQSDQESLRDEEEQNYQQNLNVLNDDSYGEDDEFQIRNFDLDYPRQKIVGPDDFLCPLINVISLQYPTDALDNILQEEDMQFVKPFLKPKIYKSRFNERVYDINVNPIANIKYSPLFEAYRFFTQPHIQEQIQSQKLNEIHDSDESFYSVDSVEQKNENNQEDDFSEIDENLLIRQHLESQLEQKKSELKNVYRVEDPVDPKLISDKQDFDQDDFDEESRQRPNIYDMQVEYPETQNKKQENRAFNYEQEQQEQQEFTHGNISMGTYLSDNPIMKILQQATGSKEDEDQFLYDSSYQSQEDERSNKAKRNKSKPNTLRSKLGFDRRNQQIVEQPPISFDPNEVFDRKILEPGVEQTKVEEDAGVDNIEQKFLKNPDQEDDYKENLFVGYYSVELNQANIDILNREIFIGEKQKQQDINDSIDDVIDPAEYKQLSLVQMIEKYSHDVKEINLLDQLQSQNKEHQDQSSLYIDENQKYPHKSERLDQLNQSLYNQNEDEDENQIFEKRLSNISMYIESSDKKQYKQKKIKPRKKELYQLYEDQEVLNVEDVEIAKLLLQDDLLRKDEAEMAINNKKFAESCDKFCKQLCSRQGFNIQDALTFAARDNVHLQVQDYLRYDIMYRPIMTVYNKYKQPDMIQLISVIFEYLRDNISYEDQGPGILFSFLDKHVQEWYFEDDRLSGDITQVPYAQVFRALVHIANKINLRLVQKKEDEETDFLIYLGKGLFSIQR
ncbi:hypothetical protein pb186bvf_010066 [Paramecium bursaria]